MSNVTQRPWRLSKSGTCVDLPNGSQIRLVKLAEGQNDVADAKHVVRCVNSFDYLLENARLSRDMLAELEPLLSVCDARLKEHVKTILETMNLVISKAEGRE